MEERIVTVITRSRSLARTRRSLAAGSLLAGACALAVATGASGSVARTARTISLNDTGHLHKTSVHGLNLYESGSASGSLAGSISVHLDVISTNRVTAQVTVFPHGGSLSGNASARYTSSGSTESFSGTLSIDHGTGSYSHASGSDMSFSGTIQRSNDALTVKVSGKLSY
jgi:hypothetical protein